MTVNLSPGKGRVAEDCAGGVLHVEALRLRVIEPGFSAPPINGCRGFSKLDVGGVVLNRVVKECERTVDALAAATRHQRDFVPGFEIIDVVMHGIALLVVDRFSIREQVSVELFLHIGKIMLVVGGAVEQLIEHHYNLESMGLVIISVTCPPKT